MFEEEIAQFRNKINEVPLTKVKKQIIQSAIDYVDDRLNQSSFFAIITTNVTERLVAITNLFQLAKLHNDDQFIIAVKAEANKLPASSDLKAKLNKAILSAEEGLQQRRAQALMYAAGIAVVFTCYQLLSNPSRGVALLAMEAGLTYLDKVRDAVNMALELYETTSIAPVQNGDNKELALVTTYQLGQ